MNQSVLRTAKRRFFWKCLGLLPQKIRSALVRSQFRVEYELPSGLEFKIAETREELEQSFKLLYEEFHSQGVMPENPALMRITKYHALPGTTVLIGKMHGQVICTLSVIRDSHMGLPVDSAWNLDELRKQSSTIAEISALAISRSAQGRRGKILLPFCKFMHEYCVNYAGIDIIVASTLSVVKEFYSSLLLFEPIGDGKPIPYGFVNNFLSTGQFLDLRTSVEKYIATYNHKMPAQNLYKYFCETHFEQFKFPNKTYGQCIYPVMSPETLDYFFHKRLSVFEQMTSEERQFLKSSYFYKEYTQVIDNQNQLGLRAREYRQVAHLQVTIVDPLTNALQPGHILEVSQSGLVLKTQWPFKLRQPLIIQVKNSSQEVFCIHAIPLWRGRYDNYGCQITSVANDQWKNLVEMITHSSQTAKKSA